MSDHKCKTQHDHVGHLCVLFAEGKMDALKQLVTNPQFMCFNCGRVADDALHDDGLCPAQIL